MIKVRLLRGWCYSYIHITIIVFGGWNSFQESRNKGISGRNQEPGREDKKTWVVPRGATVRNHQQQPAQGTTETPGKYWKYLTVADSKLSLTKSN